MKFKHYWKTIVFAILILTASILSGKQLNKVHVFEIKYFDKIVHFIMYFVLVLSMFSSYIKSQETISLLNKILFALLGITYGLTLEGIQFYFTTDRSAELADMIANTIGSVTATLLYSYLFKYRIFRLL